MAEGIFFVDGELWVEDTGMIEDFPPGLRTEGFEWGSPEDFNVFWWGEQDLWGDLEAAHRNCECAVYKALGGT